MSSLSPITARYAETDRMGVIHHAVYPVWYEVARTDYVRTLGLTYSQLEEMGVMTPLVSLTSQYRRAAYYEDRLLVECTLSALTPARVEFSYRVFREGEDAPLNTGSTLHAWVDAQTFRPVNLKKRVPALYAKMEAELTASRR